MTKRILSGLVLAFLVCLFIVFLPTAILKLVITFLVILASNELIKILFPQSSRSITAYILITTSIFSLSLMFYYSSPTYWIYCIPLLLILTLTLFIFLPFPVESSLQHLPKTFLAIFYPGVLLSFLGLIRDLPHGSSWLFSVLAATFGADTGAYIFGKNFGKHKLAPHVSPGKTIEGLVGGILFSIAVLFFVNYLIFHFLDAKSCFILGILIGLFGPLGDLSESLLKRGAGVKDSGNLIPGHGGLLDRIDALLFTSPVVYYYAVLIRG